MGQKKQEFGQKTFCTGGPSYTQKEKEAERNRVDKQKKKKS